MSESNLCPECEKPMRWQEGLLNEGSRDGTVGRYYCPDCHLNMRQTESKAIRKGKALAHELEGVATMDKRITRLPGDVQIGVLRARQHCKKCGKPNYPRRRVRDYCRCETCNCLYCQTHIRAKDDPDFLQLEAKEVQEQLEKAR